MPIKPIFLAPFCEGQYYHIYNRTNGSHKMFRNAENYRFFIQNFENYLKEVLDIYSYCLLPSHFHYIVRVKQLADMIDFLKSLSKTGADINTDLINIFRAFFTGYTMAFNKYHHRQGSLFNHKFRRVLIDDIETLKDRIFYVHSNPVHHSLTKEFRDYKWSSYPIIVSGEPTIIKREEVLGIFGGKDQFIKYHDTHKAVIARPE